MSRIDKHATPGSIDKHLPDGRFETLQQDGRNVSVDPGTTTAIAPGFGSWTTADSDRPARIELEIHADTDGTTDGQVDVDVDESGGTTADYSFSTVSPSGVGGSETQYLKVYVPAGGQYRINNVSDPNLNNAINVARQITA